MKSRERRTGRLRAGRELLSGQFSTSVSGRPSTLERRCDGHRGLTRLRSCLGQRPLASTGIAGRISKMSERDERENRRGSPPRARPTDRPVEISTGAALFHRASHESRSETSLRYLAAIAIAEEERADGRDEEERAVGPEKRQEEEEEMVEEVEEVKEVEEEEPA
ncbi:hypothetical protein KM043_004950 [Ampulex compressa]|nr:hypothetical protein KM043_004950 [Ampulex compressa]